MDIVSVICTLASGFLPGWVTRLANSARTVQRLSTLLWWISPQGPPPPPLPPPYTLEELRVAMRDGLKEALGPMVIELKEIRQSLNRLERQQSEGLPFTISMHGTLRPKTD
jgi:hypothetical protein